MNEERITSCIILFRTYSHGFGNLYPFTMVYEDKFESVAKLKEYFHKYGNAGSLVGYGNFNNGEKIWAKRAEIIVKWTDKGSTFTAAFDTAKEFADFLNALPTLAAALGWDKVKK